MVEQLARQVSRAFWLNAVSLQRLRHPPASYSQVLLSGEERRTLVMRIAAILATFRSVLALALAMPAKSKQQSLAYNSQWQRQLL
jgi:hypothetical protein